MFQSTQILNRGLIVVQVVFYIKFQRGRDFKLEKKEKKYAQTVCVALNTFEK